MGSPTSRWILALLLAAGWVAATAAPAPITSVRAVVALSKDEARRGLPALVEGVVAYYNPSENTLFIDEDGIGVYVYATTDLALAPGDRVRVAGRTQSSGFRPSLGSSDIVLLGHGPPLKPVPATFDELIQARRDSTLVTVRGVARTADMLLLPDFRGGGRPMRQSAHIQLLADGGYIETIVDSTDAAAIENLLDAEVQVTGVAAGVFDGKYHLTGACLYVSSLDSIRVIRKAATSPWSLPITPMGEIIHALHQTDLSGRVRVNGTITYYRPGTAVVLQRGAESLWIGTLTRKPLRVGDLADAVGFPDAHSRLLSMNNAEVEDGNVYAPVEPRKVRWAQLASSRSVFDLVSIEGLVVSEVREGAQDEYVLRSDGKLLSAFFRDGAATAQNHPQAAMKNFAEGSTVRVTGICIPEDSSPSSTNMPFSLLMRSADDITVVAKPAWLNARHVAELVGLLLLAVFCFLARMWVQERTVRRQIAALAYAESRRSKILEDINNSRPLAEILERVTELVSARLNGAACWCEVANGARLGNPPSKLDTKALRVAEKAIPARSGPALGTLYAAFDANTSPRREEAEALTMAAGLATLAIETERLYSDLVHRSEFDQLTDIQNRFSFEKRLEEAIHAARRSAGIFGLLYIDLNDFKQVNDVYGHRAGDLYLKEAASRMIKQLRPGDCLARLGGDEFAVLLPEVHSRAAVEEIAVRLEACYDEPYEGEGHLLRGSASIGIAMYPDDATTGDGLLSAADSAMYLDKQRRPGKNRRIAAQRDREMSPENLA